MYVPWQPIDVVKQGRIRWNRRKTWTARTSFFTDQTKWVVEPAQAPFITGFGVLVSKVHYKYSGVTPELRTIYGGLTHDLIRILGKYKIKEDPLWKNFAKYPYWRGYWSYRVANDLFNKVIGRSNGAITAASTRLAESNLSPAERRKINNMISSKNNMICIYDFRRDFLYKPKLNASKY